MKEATLQKLLLLKKAIDEDKRIKTLDALEEKISSSKEIASLSKEMKNKAEVYANSLYFDGSDSNATPTAQKELYKAKLALDTNPLAKEYNDAYKDVRRLLSLVDTCLFAKYSLNVSCGEKHHA